MSLKIKKSTTLINLHYSFTKTKQLPKSHVGSVDMYKHVIEHLMNDMIILQQIPHRWSEFVTPLLLY